MHKKTNKLDWGWIWNSKFKYRNDHSHKYKRHKELLLLTILGIRNTTGGTDGHTDACWMWTLSDTNGSCDSHLKLHIFLSDYDIWWKMDTAPQKINLYLWALLCVCITLYNFMVRNYSSFILNTYWVFVMCQSLLSYMYLFSLA